MDDCSCQSVNVLMMPLLLLWPFCYYTMQSKVAKVWIKIGWMKMMQNMQSTVLWQVSVAMPSAFQSLIYAQSIQCALFRAFAFRIGYLMLQSLQCGPLHVYELIVSNKSLAAVCNRIWIYPPSTRHHRACQNNRPLLTIHGVGSDQRCPNDQPTPSAAAHAP